MKRIIAFILIVSFLLCEPFAMAETGVPAQAPTVEELTEGYFRVLSGIEFGTAGVSLKTAIAASMVYNFAVEHELNNPDVKSVRNNMLAAFERMNDDEQTAFWEGFDSVRAILEDCLEDWKGQRPLFEDAGVAEAMDEVIDDPLNRLAWENLRDFTLTMGNAMDVG